MKPIISSVAIYAAVASSGLNGSSATSTDAAARPRVDGPASVPPASIPAPWQVAGFHLGHHGVQPVSGTWEAREDGGGVYFEAVGDTAHAIEVVDPEAPGGARSTQYSMPTGSAYRFLEDHVMVAAQGFSEGDAESLGGMASVMETSIPLDRIASWVHDGGCWSTLVWSPKLQCCVASCGTQNSCNPTIDFVDGGVYTSEGCDDGKSVEVCGGFLTHDFE